MESWACKWGKAKGSDEEATEWPRSECWKCTIQFRPETRRSWIEASPYGICFRSESTCFSPAWWKWQVSNTHTYMNEFTYTVYRLEKLTWHDNLIPSNEIWLKIGGDKGGSSFKMSIQIVNVTKPNSVNNSCVFSLFEAPDSVLNLHIALDQYHDAISDLQES